MKAEEVNFDGLVGPTHNYAGLSHGNVASMTHRGLVANPRAAALQGLAKMKFLADLGLRQAILPPQARPSVETLRTLGFGGTDAAVLAAAAKRAPRLLAACSSASNMWVANAATMAPSSDTADQRAHFTPANLVAKFHRSIEPTQTARTLRAIFRDPRHFAVHDAIPGGQAMGDEGAANHTRFAPAPGDAGVHFFVYGHHALGQEARGAPASGRFSSRQAREASAAVARLHGLAPDAAVFAQQSPAAIAAGVFHNDVIAVGHENVLLYHESAFVGADAVVANLRHAFARLHPGVKFVDVRVRARTLPLRDVVGSYLFNSQLVTVGPGRMALVAAAECAANPRVREWLEERLERGDTPIRKIHYLDLGQSMRNGGGPACLRLRVVLTDAQMAALPPNVFLTDRIYRQLTGWVKRHYREKLTAGDLADPRLLEESRRALDELTRILGLGSIYAFQT